MPAFPTSTPAPAAPPAATPVFGGAAPVLPKSPSQAVPAPSTSSGSFTVIDGATAPTAPQTGSPAPTESSAEPQRTQVNASTQFDPWAGQTLPRRMEEDYQSQGDEWEVWGAKRLLYPSVFSANFSLQAYSSRQPWYLLT